MGAHSTEYLSHQREDLNKDIRTLKVLPPGGQREMRNVIEKLEEKDPYHKEAKRTAELCPVVRRKAEFVNDELQYSAEDIFKQLWKAQPVSDCL